MDESSRPTGPATPAELIWWPQGFPASPCPPPESVWERLTRETAGLISRMPLVSFDPGSLSSRTQQPSLPLMEALTGDDALVIWPRSGCMLDGSVYELPRPALPTGGTGSGASVGEWRTPCATDSHGHAYTEHGLALPGQVAEWPTPIASDGEKGPIHYKRGNPSLSLAVKKEWPTPTAGGAKASGAQGYSTESGQASGNDADGCGGARVAHPDSANLRQQPGRLSRASRAGEAEPGSGSEGLADSASGECAPGSAREPSCGSNGGAAFAGVGLLSHGLARGPRDGDRLHFPALGGRWPAPRGAAQEAWEPPRTCGRIPGRAHQLRALGNGWCVPQALMAWRMLTGG
jgi:hypothetical protein